MFLNIEILYIFQNDDAPVSLMEMRFHIPISDSIDQDPVEAFHQQVMEKASVISVSGDAIAIFREIQCLTPRYVYMFKKYNLKGSYINITPSSSGRYDIKIFQSFFQLHGKTFDYKIPMSTVLRLFLLPHKDNRQMYFVVNILKIIFIFFFLIICFIIIVNIFHLGQFRPTN